MTSSLFRCLANQWHFDASFNHREAQLVLCFAAKHILQKAETYQRVRQQYPQSHIALCSTAGEIYQSTVHDNSLVGVALHFEQTNVMAASVNIQDFANRFEAAKHLAANLPTEGLTYVLVLSDGSQVNGSELVAAFGEVIPPHILVTGGLAGDGAAFQSTVLGLNRQPVEGEIIAIGCYGEKLVVRHGSQGGWDVFGLEKEITRSYENVLYDIGGENALELYKKYLGSEAEQLPGAALLFPLSIRVPGRDRSVVRTILSIDEANGSMTFAGNMPVGAKARFMKANFDKLTEAAALAAQQTLTDRMPDFSLLVSCVGRKLILGARSDEEVEVVSDIFEGKTNMAGFYAYGEIVPFAEGGHCQLHNQTMTITSFYELS